MNGKAPTGVAEQPEIKRFTEAEFKALQQKMQKYQEAANVVNDFLDFLRQQHGVGSNEGWQLGEGCFVRPAKAVAAPAPVAAPVAVASAAKRGRPKSATKKPPVAEAAIVNGAGAQRG